MGTLKGIIERSTNEVGYIEKASNSNLDSKEGNKGTANYTKYARDINNLGLMGCQGQAWCGTFQFWIEVQEFGLEQALKNWNMTKSNYCGYSCFETYDVFKSAGKVGKTPRLGAVVIFTQSHMGRVIEINGSTFKTVEGNTSPQRYDRNGGMVAIKEYDVSDSKIKGFCYIDYETGSSSNGSNIAKETELLPVMNNVRSGQKWLNENYGTKLKFYLGALLTIDGSYGAKTRAACVCIWKDLMNRKYGTSLTPVNSNFYSSCLDAAENAVIKKGSSGTFVYICQLILSAKGFYKGKMDANYGGGTTDAVKAFKESKGLESNGVCDAKTWYALFN